MKYCSSARLFQLVSPELQTEDDSKTFTKYLVFEELFGQ